MSAERDELWKKLDESYAQLKKASADYEAVVADRNKAYTEKDEASKAHDKVSAERDELLKKLDGAYAQLEMASADYEAVVADRNKAMKTVERLDADVKKLEMELRISKELNDSLGAELDEIHKSLIWRMVRPVFRLFHQKFRR